MHAIRSRVPIGGAKGEFKSTLVMPKDTCGNLIQLTQLARWSS